MHNFVWVGFDKKKQFAYHMIKNKTIATQSFSKKKKNLMIVKAIKIWKLIK